MSIIWHTPTNPTRVYSAPLSSNFCPLALTKPVVTGVVAAEVVVAFVVVADADVAFDVVVALAVVVAAVVAAPGMHLSPTVSFQLLRVSKA